MARRGTHTIFALAGCALATCGGALHAEPLARFPDVQRQSAQGSWATEQAQALAAKAQRYAARGDVALALTAYNDAIVADHTFGPAYLGLAGLREAISDYSEADQLYLMAAQLPEVAAEARARRAALQKRLGRGDEAIRELESAVRMDPNARARLRELVTWYTERRAWPAALAVSRQLLSELEDGEADPNDVRAAKLQVQALSVLAGETDPVQNGKTYANWVRRSLAHLARRAARPQLGSQSSR